MTTSTKLPHHFTPSASQEPRTQVEVQLVSDTVELDISYQDRNHSQSARRIKPVALTVLASGELALIAICQLRQEQRCFVLNRIQQVVFPGFASKPIKGEELMEWLQPDVKRLMAQDATVNGIRLRKARPYREVVTNHSLADMEVSRSTVALESGITDDKSLGIAMASLAAEVTGFAKEAAAKASRKPASVAITVERRDDKVRVHVDTTHEVAQHIRDGSNHARIALLKHKAGIEKSAAKLYGALHAEPLIGHDNLTLRLVLKRQAANKSIELWFALDGNWINLNPNAASTLTTKLKKIISRLNNSCAVKSMGKNPSEWIIESLEGVYRIHAPKSDEVIPRFMALGTHETLQVLTIAKVVNPGAPAQIYLKDAA